MSLLAPLGLLGLLAVAVLIFIYIIKPNYQQKIVSSTYIWKRSLKYRKKRVPVSRLRNILIFLCQMLVLASFAMLLARPVIPYVAETPKNEKVIILDASAGMRVSTGGETRFERAVREIRRQAESILSQDDMILSVIVADSDAHYLVSRQTRDGLAAVGMALDSLVSPELKCSYGTADMEGAATLAQDILKKNSETEVILYTATEYIDKGNFTVVNVADESDWNAAILYVKPTLEESNCYSFTVGAGCYGQSRSMTVYCELTGINGGVGTLKVSKTEYFTEAESERELLFTTDDFGGVPVTSYASMLVYLDENDSFDGDNTYDVYGGQKHTVRIQYASKYAGSSNYWKNSIGMNKAIADNKVLETKAAQEARFAKFAKDNNRADYAKVVGEIDAIIEKSNPVLYQFTCFNEILRSGIEFGTPYIVMDSLKVAVKNKDKAGIKKYTDMMKSVYESVHNKDYDHEVDRKVAKALLPLYAEMVEADALPSFYQTIQNDFKGNYDAYIDNLYDNSIFSNEKNFNKFISKPNVKALEKDPMYAFVKSKYALGDKLVKELSTALNGLELLHKTYVRGLCEMYSPEPKAPDANFTIRLTYGNVKSYNPKDGIHYKYYTTLKGVMEKEDPTNPEFVVPAKLKELYTAKDFGRYALPNGEMPACFLTTNDITGGNSGSPVINGSGELIGTAFDGNWESLSGDINFDNNLQRCIAVDIRYVLFIIDKLGGCGHLIDEMTIVE